MNGRLPELLAARLAEPLPGPVAARRFEPRPATGRYYDPPPSGARPAAVLVLLYAAGDRWHLPLTLRPTSMAAHAGQVSLPGGAVEPGETSPQAALREYHEELGTCPTQIEMLGHLSPIYVHVSNYVVTPWVGVTRQRPALVANPLEVAEVFEVPLAHLLDPANFGAHRRRRRGGRQAAGTGQQAAGSRQQAAGGTVIAPHFVWKTRRIWGATCMILGELVTVLEEMGVEV